MPLQRLQSRLVYTSILVILLIPTLWVAYLYAADYNVFTSSTRPSNLSPIVMPLVESPSEAWYNLRAGDVIVPEGVKVIGLVFYGRREYVQVLECYLEVRHPILSSI